MELYPLKKDALFDFKPIPRECLLVGSYYSHIYHVYDCEWAHQIDHRRFFVNSADAESYGYRNCRKCDAKREHPTILARIAPDVVAQVIKRRSVPRVEYGDRVAVKYEDGEVVNFVLGKHQNRESGFLTVDVKAPLGRAVHKSRLGDTVICSPEGVPPVFCRIVIVRGASLNDPDLTNVRPR